MIRLVTLAFAWLGFLNPTQSSELPIPLTDADFNTYSAAQIKLGQLLFYDRILSGSYRVSCATCHNHDRGSSNGFLLPGAEKREGDTLATNGIDPYDATRPSSRHAPHLFNVGAKQITALFSDGRVAVADDGSYVSPAGDQLPKGLQDILAVQALFPAVTGDELTGTVDSEIKAVAHLGNQAIWGALAKRVQDVPEYWVYFKRAYPEMQSVKDIDITAISNALGAFVGSEWRSTDSRFDRHLSGQKNVLSAREERGLNLFYGDAGCSTCHSGALLSDGQYHGVAAWPWRFDANFSEELPDVLEGRITVTAKPSDAYRLRTPTLRNLSYSGPYGLAGGYNTLEGIIRAHVQPDVAHSNKLKVLDQSGIKWPDQAQMIFADMLKKRSLKIPPLFLSSNEEKTEKAIGDLVAFLRSLDDEKGVRGQLGKPKEVPSSLALD